MKIACDYSVDSTTGKLYTPGDVLDGEEKQKQEPKAEQNIKKVKRRAD